MSSTVASRRQLQIQKIKMTSPTGASTSADRQSNSGNQTSLGAQMPQLTQNNNEEGSMDFDPTQHLLDEPLLPQASTAEPLLSDSGMLGALNESQTGTPSSTIAMSSQNIRTGFRAQMAEEEEENDEAVLRRNVRASIAKIEKMQEENVQLQAKVLALEGDAMRAEAGREEVEKQLKAVRQEKKELRVENESLRAKTQFLKLTCDDLKPKIGKLQAIVQKARQTREAFVHRQKEIKHLSRFNHKEQELLTALAKIVDDELKED